MGVINIAINGSFVNRYGIKATTESFSAQANGHADAVARAIEYLSAEVLPRAIALDHDLHDQGAQPSKGFVPARITNR